MKLFTLLLSLLTLNAYAADCSYTIKSEDVKVGWEAYKTPLKVGVKGTFKKYGIKKSFKGNSIKDLLEGISFKIDGASVYSKNEERDAKLAKNFFLLMSKDQFISGKVKSYAKKVLTLTITMNGVTRDVPLKVELKDDELEAQGHIDILDFSMSKSLNAINKACFALHEGKTWSDVEIELKAKYSKSCK
jgi:polyisoprenoid-binding protein YceI